MEYLKICLEKRDIEMYKILLQIYQDVFNSVNKDLKRDMIIDGDTYKVINEFMPEADGEQ